MNYSGSYNSKNQAPSPVSSFECKFILFHMVTNLAAEAVRLYFVRNTVFIVIKTFVELFILIFHFL